MRGLGRLIALPILLIALALQGLAPAQALAMPRDAFGLPICSARDLGQSRHQDPAKHQQHDCCAAACALTGLGASPPVQAAFVPVLFAAAAMRPALVLADARSARAVERPNARGPPPAILEP